MGVLSRHVSAPTQGHWEAAKAVICYLKKTIDWRLTLGAKRPRVVYWDVNNAGDVGVRWSTTDDHFLLGGAALS